MLHLPALLAVAFAPFPSLQALPPSGPAPLEPLVPTPPGAPVAPAVAPEFVWRPGEEGTLAIAPAHGMYGWNARVDAEGVRFESGVAWTREPGERAWVRVKTTSFGRVDDAKPVGAGRVVLDGERATIVRDGFVEWFKGKTLGLEQGWTIPAPPPGERSSELWIGLEFEGLQPQLAEDQKSARLVDHRARERLCYRTLVAYDVRGLALEAQLQVTSRGVGIQVDDRAAEFPVTVDPILGPSVWMFEPNGIDNRLYAAVTAGDVNGDGFSDFIFGAYNYPAPHIGDDRGFVWLFYGSPSGLSANPAGDWSTWGPSQVGARFGQTIMPLGDFNGDGYDDVAISAPGYDGGNTNEGAIYVYLGSVAGLSSTPFWTIEGNADNCGIYAGDGHVDLNGDGRGDLLVVKNGCGSAQAYAGSANPVPGAPFWSVDASVLSAWVQPSFFSIGVLLRGAGDVDADGYSDLMLGGQNQLNVPGGVLLFRGGPGGPSAQPVSYIGHAVSTQPSAMGFVASGVGDVNGDGHADVATADILFPGDGSGRCFLHLSIPGALPGAIFPPVPNVELPSPFVGGYWGNGRLFAGDLDGDGLSDLIVGAQNANAGDGVAQVFRGSPAGLTTAVQTIANPLPAGNNARFGFNSGGIGDLNGDGHGDVVILAPDYTNVQFKEGAAFVFHGQSNGAQLLPPLVGQTAQISGTTSSSFATALTTAGDANGDGFSDLLVGAPGFQGAFANEGRVLLYRARSDGTGLENTAIWTFSGGQIDARLGTSVAFAGDVNDDGYSDVLVGAPGFATSPAQFQEGKAFLFLGTSSGVLASTPAWEFESDEINAKLGQSVAGAGDVNGDGYADVFVGAPGATVGGLQDSGRVYVFLGSATGLAHDPAAVIDNPVLGDARFGASVANAGDLNRDGQTDLVVGAPDYSSGQSEEGRIYVFLGSAAGIVPTPAFTDESNSPGAHFGAAVSTAGDVDSDGFADLLIGAPDLPGGGRASVYRGRAGVAPIVPTPQHIPGLQGGARMGAAVCFAGDVNNDGFSDVAIGAPNHNGNQGEVYVHVGVSSGLAPSPALTFPGASGANLGAGLGPCGDIDGDGFSDVVLGQPGQLSGSGGAVIYVGGSQYNVTRAAQQRRVNNLTAIDALGLSDDTQQVRLQSGSNTIANVRSTPAGRTRVALEWELKSGAALLDGTNLARGAFQDIGAPTAPVTLNESISGLSPAQRHQWRHRIATTNPLFPHGLWNSIQGNGKHEKKFGTGFDCNNNGIPDSTEVLQNPALDCDANGGIDSCQIAIDPALDCDNDGILNSCELFANDCDANDYPDDCQLAQGAPDCNTNLVLDACELSPATDANGDSILDGCQFTPYCSGDGTGTACPCGNSGGAGRGCANSVNANGAVLTVTGWPSIANDTLVLRGAGMPNSASPSAIYLQGTAQDNGGLGTPIQDGLRCVTGSLIRLGTRPNSGNQSQYPDVGNQPVSIRGALAALPMPQTRYYQVFYRNAAAAFCPPGTANWTNGFTIVWGP